MSHEIFHCFGAQHNPENAGGTQQGYGYGFRVPGKFRTIMSYQCSSTSCSTGSCSCPRIPYLSANGFNYSEVAMGDATHDNARFVGEKTPTIAAFMAAVAPVPTPVSVTPPVPQPTPVSVTPPVPPPTPVSVTPPVPPPTPVRNECSIIGDSCKRKFDLFCDAGNMCVADSDCFDCDPLQRFRMLGCETCVGKGGRYCVNGRGTPMCSSPDIAQQVPYACTVSGGSAYTSTCTSQSGPTGTPNSVYLCASALNQFRRLLTRCYSSDYSTVAHPLNAAATPTHLHSRNQIPPVSPPPQCFSDRMTVVVRGKKGFTRLAELQVGDVVLTREGFSTVKSFGHYEPDTPSEFIQITTTHQQHAPLETTADHLLYAQIHQTGSIGLVPAGKIVVGDFLLTEKMALIEVKQVRRQNRVGLYAPFTDSGTILVNGVVASNYIALPTTFQPYLSFEQQHGLQHNVYAPYRIFCHLVADCTPSHENITEFPNSVSFWFPLLYWLQRQNEDFLTIFFFVAMPLSYCFSLIEWICRNIIQVLGIVMIFASWARKGKSSLFLEMSQCC